MNLFLLQVSENVLNAIETSKATTISNIAPSQVTLLDMIVKGGFIMIPLALLFLATLYVLIERFLIITKLTRKNIVLMHSVKEMIEHGNTQKARELCKSINTPESLMIEQGISRIGKSTNEVREAMDKVAMVELSYLEKKLSFLNITGRIAPMLGFIGTIIGVINIFYRIKLAGTVDIETVSDGLYQKMITSCGGLIVGVLAFISYHWLTAKIDSFSVRMEETQIDFLNMLNDQKQ